MTFKRMPDGRIEVVDGYRVCVMVPAKHIVGLIKDVGQTAHSGQDVCKVAFSPDANLGGLVGSDEPYEENGKRTTYMYVYMTLDEARMALRKAMGMTDEEISEDLGLEILGKLP